MLQNYLKYAPTHHDSTHADHLQPILSQIFNGPLEQAKRPHLPVINVQTLSPDSHPFSHATSSQVGRRSSGAGQSVAVPPSSISIAQGVSNLERPKITAVASPLASSSQSESVVPTVHLDVPTHRKSVTPQIYRTEATTITAPDPEILSQHVTNNVPSASTSGSLPSKNSSPESKCSFSLLPAAACLSHTVSQMSTKTLIVRMSNLARSRKRCQISRLLSPPNFDFRRNLLSRRLLLLQYPPRAPYYRERGLGVRHTTVSISLRSSSFTLIMMSTLPVRRDRVKPKKEVDVIDLTTPEPEARIPAQPPQRRDAGLSASSSDHLPLKRSGTSNPEGDFFAILSIDVSLTYLCSLLCSPIHRTTTCRPRLSTTGCVDCISRSTSRDLAPSQRRVTGCHQARRRTRLLRLVARGEGTGADCLDAETRPDGSSQ